MGMDTVGQESPRISYKGVAPQVPLPPGLGLSDDTGGLSLEVPDCQKG